MKKYLLLLFAMLATASTAFADSYFFVDPIELTGDPIGSRFEIPVHAYFDARVDSWQAKITLPEGLTLIRQKAYAGSDMTIQYMDESGNNAYLERELMKSQTDSVFMVMSTYSEPTPGYWYNGGIETYGNVKWEAGDYYEMFVLQVRVDDYIAFEGNLTIETKVYSSSDSRGGTVQDNGDADNPYTFETQLQLLPDIQVPSIYFEETDNGVTVFVEGMGNLNGNIIVNEEMVTTIEGTGFYSYFIERSNDEDRIIEVTAWAELGNFMSQQTSFEYVLEQYIMPTADSPIITFEMEEDYVRVVVRGEGTLIGDVYINSQLAEQFCETDLYMFSIPRTYDDELFIKVTAHVECQGFVPSEEVSDSIIVEPLVWYDTPNPEISYVVNDTAVIVTVYFHGTLYLTVDGNSENYEEQGCGYIDYVIPRQECDRTVTVFAIAQLNEMGYRPSPGVFEEIVVPALAHIYDFVENGIYYKITSEGKVSVCYESTSYNSYSGNVVIPATVTHEGVTYKVTGVYDKAFKDCADLTGVTVGSNVTKIGNAAFENCTSLTNVVLDDYVITIGSNAFNGCSSLASVTIGSGVRNIGTKAFYGCPALTSVICKPAVPPVMASSDCFDCYSIATLTVHPAVIDDYRSDANWGQFATIVESEAVNPPLGDADGDGQISIRDISTLIDMLLGM